MRRFGPIEIRYGKVQSKVNLKYDSWHKEIVSRFGSLLGQKMQDFYSTISKVSMQGQGWVGFEREREYMCVVIVKEV